MKGFLKAPDWKPIETEIFNKIKEKNFREKSLNFTVKKPIGTYPTGAEEHIESQPNTLKRPKEFILMS
jgi:hypothetical protein